MKPIVFCKPNRLHYRLSKIKSLPMEPSDFCKRWITRVRPGERGWRAECCRELAKATGLSIRTIEGWGSDFSGRPEIIVTLLRKEDLLRQIARLSGSDNLEE